MGTGACYGVKKYAEMFLEKENIINICITEALQKSMEKDQGISGM